MDNIPSQKSTPIKVFISLQLSDKTQEKGSLRSQNGLRLQYEDFTSLCIVIMHYFNSKIFENKPVNV